MKMSKIVIGLFICAFGTVLTAQDLHFTNYNFAPLHLNPAKTGGFNGSYRIGGTYRDQFRTFIDEAYQSAALWVDSPIAFVFNERQWIGAGISLFNDQVGDLGFGTRGVNLNAAYHLSLDDKYEKVFAFGAQYGMTQRGIGSPENANFADGLTSTSGGSQDMNLISMFSETYTDLNVGVNYKQKVSKGNSLEFGASLYHALAPRFFFNGSSFTNRIERRLNFYLETAMQLSKRFQLNPAVYYSKMGQAQITQIQVNSKTLLTKKGSTLLTAGIGYRINDAFQLLVGAIYKQWEFGLSYDMTVSTASEYNRSVGGLELGVKRYIVKFKKPKVSPVLICPRT